MLMWPWILFGIVWQSSGLEMNPRVAKVVMDHPQGTNFFVTLIGNFVLLIVSLLFSTAFTRFSEKWVIVKTNQEKHITVFHISLLAAFKDRKIPWSISDLFVGKRCLAALLVLVCMGAFTFILSATTSLISPAPFKKRADFPGMELDFTSATPDCIRWPEFSSNLSRRASVTSSEKGTVITPDFTMIPTTPGMAPDIGASVSTPNSLPTLPSACNWTVSSLIHIHNNVTLHSLFSTNIFRPWKI